MEGRDLPIRIKASRPTYRRGGLVFSSGAWMELEPEVLAALALRQFLAIAQDPVLTIQVGGEDGGDGWRTLSPFERAGMVAEIHAQLARVDDRKVLLDAVSALDGGAAPALPEGSRIELTTGGPLAAVTDPSGVEQQQARLAHNQEVAGANPAPASTDDPESENTAPAGDPAGGGGEPGGSHSEGPATAPAAVNDGTSEADKVASPDGAEAGETSASNDPQASAPEPAASKAAEDGGGAASSAPPAAPKPKPAKAKAPSKPSSRS